MWRGIPKSHVLIRKVWERKAAAENCSVMINSPPDSRRCLHCCVKLQVAMSYYPCLANGRRGQIIHLPWWRRGQREVSAGEAELLVSQGRGNEDSKWQLKVTVLYMCLIKISGFLFSNTKIHKCDRCDLKIQFSYPNCRHVWPTSLILLSFRILGIILTWSHSGLDLRPPDSHWFLLRYKAITDYENPQEAKTVM